MSLNSLAHEYKADPRERPVTFKDLRHEILTARKAITNLLNQPEALPLSTYDKTLFVLTLHKLKELREIFDFVDKSEELAGICGKYVEYRKTRSYSQIRKSVMTYAMPPAM